ncbi:alpha/beta fold hydrolase [Gemmatirosa kalamazoonensis]|uniref:alpha/beta fold hydrolase n=1 Tax=Gemmatirosa kalamazoonensis TaxID=861299 RepID=UPI0004B6F7CA|nr:alpha/beta fold hydrolase [Gemmatirosa kalamazoonensis]
MRHLVTFGVTAAALVAHPVGAQSREPFAGLDAYVENAMRQWKVPGLGLAIVRNDSVIYAKGYGVKDVNRPDRVDERTLFAIGSASKAFTAASVAMLVDEKKVSLDAPAATYLPGFALADPFASREITVRDLLAHRSGLARGELAWYGSGFDRDEIVRRVRFLQPSWSFRSQFGYQNIMYIAAGQIVAHVANTSWDDFVKARIFTPLGMTGSNTTVRAVPGVADRASPHYTAGDTMKAIAAWRDIDNAGPAGSINSTAVDMAQWVRFQLGDGTFGGKRLLSARMIDEMHSPQTIIRLDSAARALNPDTHLQAYGMGWFVQDYRDRLVVQHGGNVDGFTSLVAMLPEEHFGLVFLTNMNGTGLPTALMNKIFDLQLKAPARDWSGDMRARVEQQQARARTAQQRAEAQRVPNTKPSLPLSAYAGTYSDSLYGDMTIREENGKLNLTFGPIWKGELEHWHFDTFHTKFDTPVLGTIPITFHLNAAAKVDELATDLAGPVTFKKRPDAATSGTAAGRSAAVDYSAPPNAPYTAENVTVPTPMGHTLAGTLTLPNGASKAHPVAAVVTITGSGPEERDEAIPGVNGYRPFRQIADSLGRRGIAVLRMDDRGTGLSTGNHATATSADFAEDIRAGLAYLRTRPEIDASRLALLGHSEGGLIAPLVATKEPALKALVLMAGPGKGGREILTFQLTNLATHDTSLTGAKRDAALAAIPARIDSLARSNPWMGYFLSYDPLATARRIKIPVLILNGSTDQQVTPEQVPALAAAFRAAGNRDVTVKVFPDMNHLFIHDPSGYPLGYSKLPNPRVEPEVLGAVADWLSQRLK